MNQTNLLYVLGTVVVLALGWFLSDHLIKEVTDVPIGYQGEARSNRYLAAQRFMEKRGLDVRSVRNLSPLDALPDLHSGDHSVLILTARRSNMPISRQQALMRWVEEGGHLVLGYGARPAERFFFFAEDVRPEMKSDYIGEQMDVYPVEVDGNSVYEEGEEIEVRLPGLGHPLDLDFDPRFVLETDQSNIPAWVDGSGGFHLLSLEHGKGLMTFVTEMDLFRHPKVGLRDHAEFLWHIVHLADNPDHVWIAFGVDMPGIHEWIWVHLRPMVLALLALFLLYIARHLTRFGPILDNPSMQRRRVLEHVVASGEFLWDKQRGGHLLNSVQQRLQRQLDSKHPELRGMNSDKKAQRLAQLSGLTVEETRYAQEAVDKDAEIGPDTFTQRIQLIETIRKRL